MQPSAVLDVEEPGAGARGAVVPGIPRPMRSDAAADDPAHDQLLECLVALTRFYERPLSSTALVAGLPLATSGLTAELLPRAAERAGLNARVLRRELRSLDAFSLPCILFLDGAGACVLLAWEDGDAARLLLPDGPGVATLPVAVLAARYAGVAAFVRPEPGAAPTAGRAPASASHWFWSALAAQWPLYAEVVVASLFINAFALAGALFTMNVYDRVIPNDAVETLWVLTAGILTVFVFDFVLKTLRGYFVDSAGRVVDIRLAGRLFEQVMGLRLAARPASAGGFANQVREFESLREFFTSATLTALVDLPFVVLFILVVWLLGGPLALIPLLAVPLVLGVGWLMQIPLDRLVRRSLLEGSLRHGVLVEAITGLETVKSIGAEGRMQGQWERSVAAAAEAGNRARLLSSLTVNMAGVAGNLVNVLIVVCGVGLITRGELTAGGLVACTIVAGRAMAPLGQVAGLLTRLQQSRASLETLDTVMALPIERPAGKRFLRRSRIGGDIEFRGVGFTYPGQATKALADVSFRLGAGERVGLVGRIGSGKSTIEKLLLGLYEPAEGAVLLDGIDLRQIDPADLRRHVGCVPQDVFLFQGTLRENIAMGAGHVDDATVLRAARLAGVEDFAARHPLGYDLEVGERGQALSGGQRQAVAVARALLLQPPILVLDEPTSAMDQTGEVLLKARLAPVLDGRTLILVTHRPSLLTLVDRLIVLDGGRITADGPKETVLRTLAARSARGQRDA